MNRWQALQQVGCIACRILGYPEQPCDIHHTLSGHVRRGDQFTVGLCPYHHRGVWNDRFQSLKNAQSLCGPSLALEPNEFRARFGSDEALLTLATSGSKSTRVDQGAYLLKLLTLTGKEGWCREHRFHPTRKWRVDVAHVQRRIAIEINGGVWMKGGAHALPTNILRDYEKANELNLAGWLVLIVTPEQVKSGAALELIERALTVARM